MKNSLKSRWKLDAWWKKIIYFLGWILSVITFNFFIWIIIAFYFVHVFNEYKKGKSFEEALGKGLFWIDDLKVKHLVYLYQKIAFIAGLIQVILIIIATIYIAFTGDWSILIQ
ncbi:MAG: hypothetical protein AABX29_06175 [Nanoarchaeota archaeon]